MPLQCLVDAPHPLPSTQSARPTAGFAGPATKSQTRPRPQGRPVEGPPLPLIDSHIFPTRRNPGEGDDPGLDVDDQYALAEASDALS